MADIPHFQFNITGATGSLGTLGPKGSWFAYIFPRGANAAQDSTGALITFDAAAQASRFAANNWIQVGTDTSKIVKVTAVGGNSISVNSSVTVTENDRVFLIGNTQPTVVGGSATYTIPNTLVRQRGDDAADLYTNSMITSNSDGLISGYALPAMYDVMIQDGNGANAGYIADLEVGTVEGVSVTDTAFFSGQILGTAGISASGGVSFSAPLSIITGNSAQVRLGSDSGTNPTGNVTRFGEAALWAAGSDNAPYKTWSSADQGLILSRVHLQDGGANEQYNLSTRTNFKGNWTAPQIGVIHETQWRSVDGASCQNLFGEQSVARIAVIGTGGTAPTLTLIAGVRGDVKISNSATGTVVDGAGIQCTGPNKDGGWSGSITRGSAVLARTGDGALTNYAIQIEQGGGIVALQALNTFTLANHPAITTQLFHNQLAAKYTGGVTQANFAFRCLDIAPRIEFTTSGAGTFDSNVTTGLHVGPEWGATQTVPLFSCVRLNLRNIVGGTVSAGHAVEIAAPTNSGGGTITRYRHINMQDPGAVVSTNRFHFRMTPTQTTTPKTLLDSLSPQIGDFLFIEDTDNPDNSGPAFYDGVTWTHWTRGGIAAPSDT